MSENINEVLTATKEITLNDKVFEIKPIDIGDFGDFQNWCLERKQNQLVQIYKMVGEGIDMDKIMSYKMTEEDYDETLKTIDGMAFLIKKSIERCSNDAISYTEIKQGLKLEKLQDIAEFVLSEFMKTEKIGEPEKN